ncbi:ABC transporter permease [Alteraurantiacibacter aquimixticola]|uniref:ABC transporter permease subunit n=1 Tax=Alteraurantiacibacter aquimixticola TaxID=2489173 RepID=A0A4T3EYU9_9SPHN|nr:ABC transporter permease subunit [Alteraurantiacibacter aquimixticola]TIX49826.1 ABC transporter permease subunit [Alteraurantiacibacter aquimixticola]
MRWVNRRIGRTNALLMGIVPILLLLVLYLILAAERNAINPADKILPLPGAMIDAMRGLVFERDQLSGRYLFWADTLASLQRLGLGIAISTASALLVGLVLGLLPPVRATFGMLVTGVAVIPPIALLPILFIAFGLGETAKVALIVVGIAPFMIRDVAGHVGELPREQIIKAQTLGASTWQLMLRVVLPQAMPRLIQAVRLSLGPAWVFLISAEAIAADIGLGYRIFLVRRYLAMDVILPYVAWIAILAAVADLLLVWCSRRMSSWAHGAER